MATIDGTAGNDTLIGTSGDDLLNGLAGNDSIDGRAGNDTIFGGEGADTLFGGLGNDSLDGGSGADSLFGGPGNNILLGGGDNDTLYGFAGNDSLNGGPGDDLLAGRRGTNVYDDISGFDTVDLQYSSAAITLNINGAIFHDGGEVDTLASGIERVSGSFFGDTFSGSGANDDFVGITGNDTLSGGDGGDRIDGGAGDDLIEGQGGNDTLLGGDGDDLLHGGSGANSITGGEGQDTLSYEGSATGILLLADGTVTHDGGDVDTISGVEVIVGSNFDDAFTGTPGNDYFIGGPGNDVLGGGPGNDTLEGGANDDTLNAGAGDIALLVGGPGSDQLNASTTALAIAYYTTSPTGIFVDADANANMVQDGFGTIDTLIGIDHIIGSPHNDTMAAGIGIDRLFEFAGNGGNDSFVGGGFGTVSTGLVRVRYDFEPAGGQIDLSSTGFGMFPSHFDTLVDIHDVIATPFNDSIFGSIDPDKIDAAAGDDFVLEGASGNDTIATGAGNDTVVIGLTSTSSTIDFGSGDDTFTFALVGAPPPVHGVALTSVTTWQTTSPTTLMVTQAFDGDVFGRAVIEKPNGALTLNLPPFQDQSFDVASYLPDLVVVAGGSPLTGTLGQGDDVVLADDGDYSLDGGGGRNTVDYDGLASGITAAIDGDQATVQLPAAIQTLQRFSTYVGTQLNDTFTSTPFDATAPFDANAVTVLLETVLPPNVPTIIDSQGDDSYHGRMIVDFRGASAALTISPTLQPGVFQAVIPGDTDTLQDVTALLLPTVGSTVDYANSRNVLLQVSSGSHHLTAGPGSLLSYAAMTTDLSIDLAQGRVAHGNGNDTIAGIANVIGGSGDDTLIGDGQDNVLAPAAGNNTVDGGGGNDTVVFGFGLGALGDQVYFPESQRLLFLTADTGAETAESVGRVETVAFADQVMPIGEFARDLPTFAATTVVGALHPSLFASVQNDDIDGSTSADIILDRGGANRVDGSGGNDLIRMAAIVAAPSAPPEPAADLPPGLAPTLPVAGDDGLMGGEGSDTILSGAGADIVDGSAGDDLLFGDGGADSIGGGAGSDLLFGGAGNDLLFGEDGNDSLFGDQGQDILVGGAGDDRLYGDGGDLELLGGGGFDILAIGANTAGLASIDLEAPANQNQSNSVPAVSGIEAVDASFAGMAVSLHGTAAGSAGAMLVGSGFGDTIAGGGGNDTLVGRGGNDLLAGGSGNDRIVLDAGNDTAIGGSGSDDFVYAGLEGSGGVQVTDFVPGQDRMVLSITLAADGAAAVSQLGMTGIGAIIDFGDGRTITFVGVAAASFLATDFLIDAGL